MVELSTNRSAAKRALFFGGQAQIQYIHQCAEHRSNTGGDWKAKSTSNNVAKTGEEEVRTILMSYTYSMRFFFFFAPLNWNTNFHPLILSIPWLESKVKS